MRATRKLRKRWSWRGKRSERSSFLYLLMICNDFYAFLRFYYMGFAHLRNSITFVFVHCISCHEIGTKDPPATLVPKITPSSFAAVDR